MYVCDHCIVTIHVCHNITLMYTAQLNRIEQARQKAAMGWQLSLSGGAGDKDGDIVIKKVHWLKLVVLYRMMCRLLLL